MSPQSHQDSDSSVGSRVREARTLAGFRQADGAERASMSVAKMSRVELGQANLRRFEAEALGALYGVSPDWLLTGDGARNQEPTELPPASEPGHVRQYRICPTCGEEGLSLMALEAHLASGVCTPGLDAAQAKSLAANSDVDPAPWAFVVARYRRQIDSAKRQKTTRQLQEQKHWSLLVGIIERNLEVVLRMGPDRFQIRNPRMDDPYLQTETTLRSDWSADPRLHEDR